VWLPPGISEWARCERLLDLEKDPISGASISVSRSPVYLNIQQVRIDPPRKHI
jgi:hypothetical protein